MEDNNDMEPISERMDPKFEEMFPKRLRITQISTTLLRKKEDVAARTLQKAWLGFKTKQVCR